MDGSFGAEIKSVEIISLRSGFSRGPYQRNNEIEPAMDTDLYPPKLQIGFTRIPM
jgi:hypothetical protein